MKRWTEWPRWARWPIYVLRAVLLLVILVAAAICMFFLPAIPFVLRGLFTAELKPPHKSPSTGGIIAR